MSDAARNNEEAVPLPVWLKQRIPFEGYTYREYKKWDESIRVELINGTPKMMASPNEWHQWVLMEIGSQLKTILKGKKCTPYMAPFDARLYFKKNLQNQDDESDKTIVQPDILVVCDPEKLEGGHGVKGAPDFIIEILSEFNAGHDLIDKKYLYEKAGVNEYWIIATDRLYTYILADGKYQESVILFDENFKQSNFIHQIKTLQISIDFRAIIERYL